MSTDVAVRQSELELVKEELRHVINTNFVPEAYRGKPLEALACVLAARELGIGPMEALREIAMIDGRPALSAKVMVGLARKRGHSISATFEEGKVTAIGRRADTGDEATVEWTMAMAERAGLTGKKNWKTYPEAMLWARAASQLCRILFADVLTSVAHDVDELELSPAERVSVAVGSAFSPPEDGLPVGEGEGAAAVASPSPTDDEPDVLEGEVVDEGGEEEQSQFPIPESVRHVDNG